VTTSAVKPPPASTSQAQRIISRGPLFGGYTVVAFVAAWLVGIVLRAGDILPPDAAPWTWLALAGACAMLAMLAALLTPLLVQSRLRLFYLALRFLLMIGILGVFLTLGAARAAWSDPATDPTSVARYANGASVRLQGEVITEPDLRDGVRLLTVEISSIRIGSSGAWASDSAEQNRLEHRVQMLLGIFSAKAVLPLEFKSAYSVGNLLTQHLDELEDEAARKGGILQALNDHFARTFKVDVAARHAA